MKYVISDQDEIIVGDSYHRELAEQCKGSIVRAGECERLEDGWTVFGRSYGLGIKAKLSDLKYFDLLSTSQE